MIEFDGKITCEATKIVEKMWFKSISFSIIVAFAVFSAIPLYLAVAVNIEYLLYVAVVAIPFLISFLVLIITKRRDAQNTLYKKLVIDTDEQSVVAYYSGYEIFRMFEEIQSIEDHGEWYSFVFNRRTAFIIAQKDLITKGTIEEFEKLFKGVIVKVTK